MGQGLGGSAVTTWQGRWRVVHFVLARVRFPHDVEVLLQLGFTFMYLCKHHFHAPAHDTTSSTSASGRQG